MNERIKELMKQSMVEYQFDLRFSPEKFAELIVEECLYIVEGEDDGSADTKSVRLAMIRMKQHFGVEE
jgi:hypothetical protein